MKYNFKFLTVLLSLILCLTFSFSNVHAGKATFCYPDGCVEYMDSLISAYTEYRINMEMHKSAQEFMSQILQIVADDHYGSLANIHISRDGSGNIVGMSCGNGGWIASLINDHCANYATDYPTCSTCPKYSSMVGSQCQCSNMATIGSGCTICQTGLTMYNNICVCFNGATNAPTCNTCPAGSSMQSVTSVVWHQKYQTTVTEDKCVCDNGATPESKCTQCATGKVMDEGKCVDGCSMTNVCGQTVDGVLKNGVCSAPSGSGNNINNSCITTFNVSSDHTNPNGSVDFSWSLATLPKTVKSNCGFVDLTTPTPRPIPGLQNLDPTVDRTRITNIQATTRFCLICQFYNATTNASLGEAVKHQWVRVIRIGEN